MYLRTSTQKSVLECSAPKFSSISLQESIVASKGLLLLPIQHNFCFKRKLPTKTARIKVNAHQHMKIGSKYLWTLDR